MAIIDEARTQQKPWERVVGAIRRRAAVYLAEWKQPAPFDWRAALWLCGGSLILLPLTTRLPALAYEWPLYRAGVFDATYPPWLQLAISPLAVWEWRTGAALLFGLLFMSVAIGTAREARGQSRGSMLGGVLLALVTAPVLMLLWEGNASILTLMGVVMLPLGVPWATVQPHLAPWALLARRSWTLWGLVFLALTLIVWGPWPIQILMNVEGSLGHPIAMGWINLGWPLLLIGLALLPFTNADPLRLIAVGAFIAPYLMAVHLVLLLPAIGRVTGWQRVALWLCAWLTLLPAMFYSDESKLAAMIFPLAVWWLLKPAAHAS